MAMMDKKCITVLHGCRCRNLTRRARSKSDNLMAFQNSAEKREDGWVIGSGALKSLQKFNIGFPMVKWSDDSPWLIEDLKKLEVVDSYE